jgi:arylsulfatase A-like enzyme
VLRGERDRVYHESETVGYELTGHGALFQGDYKIVRNQPPLGDGQWRLFNIVTDPGETQDLRQQMPDRFEQMQVAYQVFEINNQVQPVAANYDQQRQIVINLLRAQLGPALLIIFLTALIVMPFIIYRRAAQSKP